MLRAPLLQDCVSGGGVELESDRGAKEPFGAAGREGEGLGGSKGCLQRAPGAGISGDV